MRTFEELLAEATKYGVKLSNLGFHFYTSFELNALAKSRMEELADGAYRYGDLVFEFDDSTRDGPGMSYAAPYSAWKARQEQYTREQLEESKESLRRLVRRLRKDLPDAEILSLVRDQLGKKF